MNDLNDARRWHGGLAGHMPDPQQAGKESFAFRHARYEGGQHWFSAEHDGDEVAHAYVIERLGPGGSHAEIKELRTNPHYRGRGIGSRLLENVGEHFKDHELRLRPYPIDENSGQDADGLREFYGNRGFKDYQLREGDPFELYDYMTKRASSGPAPEPAGSLKARAPGAADAQRASGERGQHDRPAAGPVYLHGGPNRVKPGDVIHQDAMPESYGRLQHNFFTTSRPWPRTQLTCATAWVTAGSTPWSRPGPSSPTSASRIRGSRKPLCSWSA
jgi:GNAT superfamily N-acetyltransferase